MLCTLLMLCIDDILFSILSNNFRYVDAFNGGKIMNEHDCIQILPYESRNTVPRNALFPTASPRRVRSSITVRFLFSFFSYGQNPEFRAEDHKMSFFLNIGY